MKRVNNSTASCDAGVCTMYAHLGRRVGRVAGDQIAGSRRYQAVRITRTHTGLAYRPTGLLPICT